MKLILKNLLKLNVMVFIISKIIQIYLKIVFLTSKIQIDINDTAEKILTSKKICLITLWHGKIIIFPKIMKKFGKFKVLTSLHKDGKYIDKFVSLYGHQIIRGSTYKGGFSAIKNIIKAIENNDRIVITPDGPRGPKFKINSAITNLATKFAIPVIYISFISTKRKKLNTWDKFTVPLPFGKILINISAPSYFKKKEEQKLEELMLQQMKNLDKKCNIKI